MTVDSDEVIQAVLVLVRLRLPRAESVLNIGIEARQLKAGPEHADNLLG